MVRATAETPPRVHACCTAANASSLARVTSRVWPRDHNLCRDRRDLFGRLAQPEHDFRKALPQLALMIHPRKAEILKRLDALSINELQDLFGGGLGGDMAGRTWSSNCCKSAKVMDLEYNLRTFCRRLCSPNDSF